MFTPFDAIFRPVFILLWEHYAAPILHTISAFMNKKTPKTRHSLLIPAFSGVFLYGPDGIRTHGLCVANAALSQLSYEPWLFNCQDAAFASILTAYLLYLVFPFLTSSFSHFSKIFYPLRDHFNGGRKTPRLDCYYTPRKLCRLFRQSSREHFISC